MIGLGLTNAEYNELKYLLTHSHRLNISIQVLDLNHNNLGYLSGAFLGGSVTIDTTTEITRSASLDVMDVGRIIQLAPEDPDDGAAYPTRMIRIYYGVGRPDASKWYYVPIFTGPVNKTDRDGAVLHIEAHGKESLSMGSVWKGKTFKPKWNKIDLIRYVMRNLAGETRFDLAKTSQKTTSKTVIARGGRGLWKFVRSLGSSMGWQVFYDGRGALRVRPFTSKPVWIFNNECLVDDPQVAYVIENLVNAVEITGAKPKGAKKPITYTVVAPKTHPLSPESLSRGGIPKYYPHIEENTDLKTYAAVKEYGDTVLRNGLLQSIEATFDSLVIPMIEENDLVSVRSNGVATDIRIKQATIPLICTDSMSVGYLKKVRPSRLSKRLRRK